MRSFKIKLTNGYLLSNSSKGIRKSDLNIQPCKYLYQAPQEITAIAISQYSDFAILGSATGSFTKIFLAENSQPKSYEFASSKINAIGFTPQYLFFYVYCELKYLKYQKTSHFEMTKDIRDLPKYSQILTMVLRSPISQGETIIIADYKGFARGNDWLDHPELKTRQKTHTDTFSSIQISKKF